jgi:hypothetical protein
MKEKNANKFVGNEFVGTYIKTDNLLATSLLVWSW